MAFVKLDCGMLDSSIWPDRTAREVFITALLMAQPFELREDTPQIRVDSLDREGEVIPAGWYGRVEAAGVGIVTRAMLDRKEGLEALKRLCECDPESRSEEHCGKRMARINGGYLILNYDKYRQKDYTSAERSKRYRDRKRLTVTRDITQAEAEAEGNAYQKPEPERASLLSPCDGDGFDLMTPETRRVLSEEIYSSYPRLKKGEHKELGLEAIERVALYLIRERPKDFPSERSAFRFLMKRTEEFASSPEVKGKIALGTTDKIPMAKNWFSDHRFDDEIF